MESSNSPSYVRVREWLLEFIAEQRLGPGDMIPSDRVIAGSLGLSRPTITRAVSELVEQGVLIRRQRIGTFVGGYGARKPANRVLTVGLVLPYVNQAQTGEIAADKTANRYREQLVRENISSDIMQGILSALNGSKCRLVVHHNNSAEEEAEVLSNLANEGLDGAIVMPAVWIDNAGLYADLACGPPTVFVDRYIPGTTLDWVVTDNLASTRDAVRCLINRGHHRIGFFTDFAATTSIKDREEGYRTALAEAGIPFDEDIVCGPQNMRYGQWSFQHSMEHCIRLADPITAAFGINDDVVWAILQAAKRLGLSVPGDLEMAGFFDASVPTGIHTPFVRVVQSKFRIGQIAVQLLMDRINTKAPPEPRHVLVPAELILGESA